jgi:hypothetical protein
MTKKQQADIEKLIKDMYGDDDIINATTRFSRQQEDKISRSYGRSSYNVVMCDADSPIMRYISEYDDVMGEREILSERQDYLDDLRIHLVTLITQIAYSIDEVMAERWVYVALYGMSQVAVARLQNVKQPAVSISLRTITPQLMAALEKDEEIQGELAYMIEQIADGHRKPDIYI